MRTALLAVAALLLLAGCREAADDPAINKASPKDAPVFPVTDDNPAARTPAAAAPATREEALKLMHERHEAMEDIGDATKALGRELKASAPDLTAVRTHAATIARLAPEVSRWFPTGTGPDVGKTRAKPEIWQKPEDFAAKTRAFQAAARSFDATARAGDVAAIKASFGELGKACKACHDPYRAPNGH
ncbi:cytochrome c [Sphingomonas sp.]|uniref:c-type cytochrome n=1 Tax=Sphingomonas sp. TaxID=28214 RepID=UPI0017DFFD6C|nr:cytochrome c [Sphingomonas sp.]MBA3512708.1 cytochrome c [Sphingomonas sp.]